MTVGTVTVAPDALPLRYRLVLDASAAAAIGWPSAVTVSIVDGVVAIGPAAETTDGARPTWQHSAGGLACVVRVGPAAPLSEVHKGRHAADLADGELVADLTRKAPRR